MFTKASNFIKDFDWQGGYPWWWMAFFFWEQVRTRVLSMYIIKKAGLPHTITATNFPSHLAELIETSSDMIDLEPGAGPVLSTTATPGDSPNAPSQQTLTSQHLGWKRENLKKSKNHSSTSDLKKKQNQFIYQILKQTFWGVTIRLTKYMMAYDMVGHASTPNSPRSTRTVRMSCAACNTWSRNNPPSPWGVGGLTSFLGKSCNPWTIGFSMTGRFFRTKRFRDFWETFQFPRWPGEYWHHSCRSESRKCSAIAHADVARSALRGGQVIQRFNLHNYASFAGGKGSQRPRLESIRRCAQRTSK